MAQKAKIDILLAAKTAGQAAIKRMGNSMQGLQGRVKNLRNTVLTLNNAFKAMAVWLAASTVTKFVTGAIDQADAFGKLSRQTGIAADTLQSYVNAAKLAGVEQSAVDKGLARLASSIREADQGVATYLDSFKALGISVRDSEGNLKSTERIFGEISDRFKEMPAGTTKAALAMELFSRQGRRLIPLLDEGSEALKKWNYQTSDEFSQNSEYFNDQITTLGFAFDGFRKQLADELLPTLNNLAKMLNEEIFNSQGDWESFFQGVTVGLKIIASTVLTVVAGFRFLITTLKAVATGLGELAMGNFKEAGEAFAGGLKETSKQFVEDMDAFEQIWKGKENAPKEYFQKGDQAANDLKETVKDIKEEMEKTFGENMNAKLTAFAKTLNDMGSMVGDTIVRAFKGAEDALVNFVKTGKLDFKSLVDSILEDLARMAIRQSITKPLFNALSSAIGGGLGGGGDSVGTQLGNMIGTYSSGGYINRPTLGMIGEGGESELVIPQSKLASAMARYQSGARGGAIVPGGNNANGGGDSGYAGGGNVTVNYNGELLRFNEENYVRQSDVGGIISAAANAGEARTMKTLKNSRSQRAMVGL